MVCSFTECVHMCWHGCDGLAGVCSQLCKQLVMGHVMLCVLTMEFSILELAYDLELNPKFESITTLPV